MRLSDAVLSRVANWARSVPRGTHVLSRLKPAHLRALVCNVQRDVRDSHRYFIAVPMRYRPLSR
jgi:hypothetical protein